MCVSVNTRVGSGTCTGEGITVVHDNTIYSPTGAVTECGMPLAKWQAQGNDPGSTAAPFPPTDTLVAVARGLLGL